MTEHGDILEQVRDELQEQFARTWAVLDSRVLAARAAWSAGMSLDELARRLDITPGQAANLLH